MKTIKKAIAVILTVLMAISMMPFTAFADTAYYEKVTENLTDWSGDYLIVYEDGNKAFNGGSSSINSAGNLIDVTISNDAIESNATTDAAKVTIEKDGDNYYVKAANNTYIGGTSGVNTIRTQDSGLANSIAYDNGEVHIVSDTSHFRFNTGWNGFRYYKSTNYTNQKAVQLYRLATAPAPTTHTITWKSDANTVIDTTVVEEGETPTHAAPADYEDANYIYTFAGWTPEVVAATADATYTAQFNAVPKVVSHLLTLLVGENGKIEAGLGTYGNATDENKIVDLKMPLVAQSVVNVADGYSLNIVEGGSFTAETGASWSFYPAATNTGVITATPAEGYTFDGWYNGETLYSTVAALDYQNISENLTLTAIFKATEPNNGASITVGETISENFYLDDDFYGETAYVSFTYNHNSDVSETADVSTDVMAMSSLDEATDGRKKFSVTQAPAQATEPITIKIYETEADADAGTNAIDTIDYSVYAYCRDIIENYTGEKAEEMKELAKSTLDYAAAAQSYFNYNTENMATKDATGDFYNDVAGLDMSEVSAPVSAAPSCIKRVSVVVKSDLEINLLSNAPLTVEGAGIAATKGTENFAVSTYQNGDYYVLHIAGIEAANMNKTITVETNEGDLVMTANSIIKMLAASGDTNLSTLAKAMYLYGTAASAYFD